VIDINQKGMWLEMKAAAYHASNGAVRLLTKTAAVKFSAAHIRVNSAHPGVIRTPMLEGIAQELVAGLAARAPLQREGTAAEVAYGCSIWRPTRRVS
jgi:NAD(P)-dependent dehydrogenase (short-subunit alcohol dehydrogenase family)